MTIILSGGGYNKQSYKLDKAFAKIAGVGNILYIPIAMPQNSRSYGICFDWFSDCFSAHGISNIDMWTTLKDKDYIKLRDYAAVYIGGGNTFHLLQEMRKTGFDSALITYIKYGGIVYGGSAGAIVLGKNIQTATIGSKKDRNTVNLKNFGGINILYGNSIKCHYKPSDKRVLSKYTNENAEKIIALPDDGGLIIHKNRAIVAGYGNVYLFEGLNVRKYEPGSTINFI